MSRYRLLLFISIIVVTPIGFATKFYKGPLDWLMNDYGAGALYNIFWILVVLWLRPKASVARVAWGVLIVTCLLEFSQAWHPPFLMWIRSFFLGRILIGTTFSWGDFPFYFVGSAAGYLYARRLKAVTSSSP